MTETTRSKSPDNASLEAIDEFEVFDDGMLRISDFRDAEIRSEFFADVFNWWASDSSPEGLCNAMGECQPLAWEVPFDLLRVSRGAPGRDRAYPE